MLKNKLRPLLYPAPDWGPLLPENRVQQFFGPPTLSSQLAFRNGSTLTNGISEGLTTPDVPNGLYPPNNFAPPGAVETDQINMSYKPEYNATNSGQDSYI